MQVMINGEREDNSKSIPTKILIGFIFLAEESTKILVNLEARDNSIYIQLDYKKIDLT